jgi:sugar phosphate isomerase/epimerase
MHSNIETDISVAAQTGFDGVEVVEIKLFRYLENGYTFEHLGQAIKQNNLKVSCINALKNVETAIPEKYSQLIRELHVLCQAACAMNCPTIQLVPLVEHKDLSLNDAMRRTAKNLADIADIGSGYGLQFQLEPIAFSPINSLKKSLDLLRMADRPNLGMVIDFWHLSAGGHTTPEDVANLNKQMIYGVHFCDGVLEPVFDSNGDWDEGKMRNYLPGEGQINIKEWTDAVKSTGYDGAWSCELYSPKYWEWEIMKIAKTTKEIMENYIL